MNHLSFPPVHRLSRQFLTGMVLLSAVLLGASSCQSRLSNTPSTSPTASTYTDTLTVSPYLYVPRLEQFIVVMEEMWYADHPDTYLEVETNWDCYSENPPDSIEVFVYDGVFLNYFLDQGYLSAIPESSLENPDDVIPYALEAGKIRDKFYSFPQIGCGNILFYRSRNRRLHNATSLAEIYQVIGPATFPGVKPPLGQGLLIDLSGGTTNACYYTATDMQRRNFYSEVNPPQSTCGILSPQTLDSLQLLVKMAGAVQASTYGGDYSRAKWFGQGSGEACVGFTEYLAFMDYTAEQVEFKPLPIGGSRFTPFYLDMIGIHAKTPDSKVEKAQDLVRLLSSAAYATASFGPDSSQVPQYLLPVRWSVFKRLGERFPLYREMEKMVRKANPKAFLLNANSRPWLEGEKSCIRFSVLNGLPPVMGSPKGK